MSRINTVGGAGKIACATVEVIEIAADQRWSADFNEGMSDGERDTSRDWRGWFDGDQFFVDVNSRMSVYGDGDKVDDVTFPDHAQGSTHYAVRANGYMVTLTEPCFRIPVDAIRVSEFMHRVLVAHLVRRTAPASKGTADARSIRARELREEAMGKKIVAAWIETFTHPIEFHH